VVSRGKYDPGAIPSHFKAAIARHHDDSSQPYLVIVATTYRIPTLSDGSTHPNITFGCPLTSPRLPSTRRRHVVAVVGPHTNGTSTKRSALRVRDTRSAPPTQQTGMTAGPGVREMKGSIGEGGHPRDVDLDFRTQTASYLPKFGHQRPPSRHGRTADLSIPSELKGSSKLPVLVRRAALLPGRLFRLVTCSPGK
jgi:hypothetical protein